MRRSFTEKLLALATCMSFACMLLASVCPTCEPVAHASDLLRGGLSDDVPFARDWQGESAACDCCEEDACDDAVPLPDGVVQRSNQGSATSPILLTASTYRRPGSVETVGLWDRPPPLGRTQLHIQHASFRC